MRRNLDLPAGHEKDVGDARQQLTAGARVTSPARIPPHTVVSLLFLFHLSPSRSALKRVASI